MTKQIQHPFHLACTPDKIINALTEADHIQKWWTKDAYDRLDELLEKMKQGSTK